MQGDRTRIMDVGCKWRVRRPCIPGQVSKIKQESKEDELVYVGVCMCMSWLTDNVTRMEQ